MGWWIFGRWIGGKRGGRKPPSEQLEAVREQVAIAMAKAQIQLINALMASRPDIAAAIVYPRVGKLMAGQAAAAGGTDRMQELVMKKLEAELLNPRDPLDQLIKLQQAGRAYRELQAELAPEPASPEPETAAGVIAGVLDSLFNSPLGAAIGGAIGQSLAAKNGAGITVAGAGRSFPAASSQPGERPALAAGSAEAATPPAVADPAREVSAPNPLVVRAALIKLERKPDPAQLAEQLIDLAERNGDLDAMLTLAINTGDADELVALLQAWTELPGWGQVAAWLLANIEYTQALVAELRRLAAEAESEDEPPAHA